MQHLPSVARFEVPLADTLRKSSSFALSNPDPLDLIEPDLIAAPVVEVMPMARKVWHPISVLIPAARARGEGGSRRPRKVGPPISVLIPAARARLRIIRQTDYTQLLPASTAYMS